MDEPAAYARSGYIRMAYINSMLEKLNDLYGWEKCESILDVGCGSGDVTYRILQYCLLSTDAYVTGLDISDKMLDFAKFNFNHDKIKYELQNIGINLDPSIWSKESYNKIFSTFVIQSMTPNVMEKMFENIYYLLKKQGYLTLHFVSKTPLFSVIEILAKEPYWSPYLENCNLVIKSFECVQRTDEYICKILSSLGFTIQRSFVDYYIGNYESMDEVVETFMSIKAYLCDVPQDKMDEYMGRIEKELKNHKDIQIEADGTVKMTWENTVIVASK